jgi:hypothetical protein
MSSFPSNTHSLVYSTEYMPKVAPNVYRSIGKMVQYWVHWHCARSVQFVRIVNSFSRSKGYITRDNPCYNSTTWYEIADKSGHVTLKVVAGKLRPKHGLLYRPFSSYFFHLSNLKSRVCCAKKVDAKSNTKVNGSQYPCGYWAARSSKNCLVQHGLNLK